MGTENRVACCEVRVTRCGLCDARCELRVARFRFQVLGVSAAAAAVLIEDEAFLEPESRLNMLWERFPTAINNER